MKDCRLEAGFDYLKNKIFEKKEFLSTKENDHEHCCFCFAKITDLNLNEKHLKEGYVTVLNDGREEWACEKCFTDFRELLNLQLRCINEQNIEKIVCFSLVNKEMIEKLSNYKLCDTSILGIKINNDKIDIYFDKILIRDHNNNETFTKINSVKMFFSQNTKSYDAEELIDIYYCNNKRITILGFNKIAKKETVIVSNIYFSENDNSVMIDCFVKKKRIMIFLKCCTDIEVK